MERVTADEIIRTLGLVPHPEGGHYVETYRTSAALGADRAQPERPPIRPCGTAIYFLLRDGERSAWHRIDADEMWHHYAGAPLELSLAAPGAAPITRLLGHDVLGGERPQLLVPAGVWQAARSLGSFSLVGCTVTPAFEFSGFELAPPGFEPGPDDR